MYIQTNKSPSRKHHQKHECRCHMGRNEVRLEYIATNQHDRNKSELLSKIEKQLTHSHENQNKLENDCRKIKSQLSDAQRRIQSLQAYINDKDDEIHESSMLQKTVIKEIDYLKSENDTLQKKLTEMTFVNNQQIEQIASMSDYCIHCDKHIFDLKAENDSLKLELERTTEHLTEDIMHLRMHIQELVDKNSKASAKEEAKDQARKQTDWIEQDLRATNSHLEKERIRLLEQFFSRKRDCVIVGECTLNNMHMELYDIMNYNDHLPSRAEMLLFEEIKRLDERMKKEYVRKSRIEPTELTETTYYVDESNEEHYAENIAYAEEHQNKTSEQRYSIHNIHQDPRNSSGAYAKARLSNEPRTSKAGTQAIRINSQSRDAGNLALKRASGTNQAQAQAQDDVLDKLNRRLTDLESMNRTTLALLKTEQNSKMDKDNILNQELNNVEKINKRLLNFRKALENIEQILQDQLVAKNSQDKAYNTIETWKNKYKKLKEHFEDMRLNHNALIDIFKSEKNESKYTISSLQLKLKQITILYTFLGERYNMLVDFCRTVSSTSDIEDSNLTEKIDCTILLNVFDVSNDVLDIKVLNKMIHGTPNDELFYKIDIPPSVSDFIPKVEYIRSSLASR